MQIGGCIMETGEIPLDDMGVIVKREPKESSPSVSLEENGIDGIESPDIDRWSLGSFTIKNESPSYNEIDAATDISDTNIDEDIIQPIVSVSVIHKNENHSKKSNTSATKHELHQIKKLQMKKQLKFHLESPASAKKNHLQDEIYKQQNALIQKEERNKFFDTEKLSKMFSIIAPKREIIEPETTITSARENNLESLPNESIKNWLQRITQLQQNNRPTSSSTNNHNILEITPEINIKQHSLPLLTTTSAQTKLITDPKRKIQSASTNIIIPPQQAPRVVNYRDLPYMGEMTLDNCKPRRGRKPKKADICHLIYKNYGTIIPGNPQNEPNNLITTTQITNNNNLIENNEKKLENSTCRSDVQNKIISSLLEKRLTLETKRTKETIARELKIKPEEKLTTTPVSTTTPNKGEEPLNLCIRDLNQLKIRLLRRHDNIYESQQKPKIKQIEVKSEPQSDDDEDDVEFITETKTPTSPISPENIKEPIDNDSASSYVLWPNSNGVFVHPMALQSQMLYYQKLVTNNNNNNYILPNSRPSSNASSNSSITITKKPENVPVENHENKVKRSNSNTPSNNSTAPPTKRKRSAIFIPPIPTENQTNPATEVSICKFKFTGGAKPSLQEKKMLSVDSGGNFRYYSGTGDKSMRGYEFFPRETLQQQAIGQNTSSSGVFLNASGEKIQLPANLEENSPVIECSRTTAEKKKNTQINTTGKIRANI
ncbi:uncharacterized protein LOC123297498 isoform X2 [Chrysoperla carnea]|uniref:uncharacterized protein LOC123297498 isoform X2 n=1 Tax=Chrysoperla carnea TaxID=189513 RepID=UPI001D05EA7F|nr:uncharacterized protein LOC123297498 isoform X2 [Chrysoperla carnea]